MAKTKWQPQWDEVLRRNWGKVPPSALAERFGISKTGLASHARRLDLPPLERDGTPRKTAKGADDARS